MPTAELRTSTLRTLLAAGAGLLLGACLLTPAGLQVLQLHFKLAQKLAAGEDNLVHQQVLPAGLGIKKQTVRVSGRVLGSTERPERLDVLVTAETVADGKIYDRFRLKVELDDGGGFVATGRWRKDIRPATLLSVFVTPVGADLEGEVDLCVHVSKSKGALAATLDCAPGKFELDPADALELDSVGFHEIFTVGGSFPTDLGATSGRELVVALRDLTRPDQTCPAEVPWDGCASVDWDDVDGVRNAPPGGGYFDNRIRLATDDGSVDLYLNRSLGLDREQDDDFALG